MIEFQVKFAVCCRAPRTFCGDRGGLRFAFGRAGDVANIFVTRTIVRISTTASHFVQPFLYAIVLKWPSPCNERIL